MPFSYKMVLLGEGRVGKTSLLSRYVHDKFNANEPTTESGVMFTQCVVPVDPAALPPGSTTAPPSSAQVQLWDTAGQERFHALAPVYYRNAQGAMIVFDIGDRDTLTRARTWVEELHSVVGTGISIVLVGNKIDQGRQLWDITEAEANTVAQELQAKCVFVSAKTGEGVREAFSLLTHALVGRELSQRQLRNNNNSTPGRSASKAPRALEIGDDDDDFFNSRSPNPNRVLLTENNNNNNASNNNKDSGGCC